MKLSMLVVRAQESKPFVNTATVVVNVLMTIIAVLGLLVQQTFVKPEVVPYIVFVAAVLNIVLKLWFPGEVPQTMYSHPGMLPQEEKHCTRK